MVAQCRMSKLAAKESFEDWLYFKDGFFWGVINFFWKIAVGISKGFSAVLPLLKRNCSVAIMMVFGVLAFAFGTISILLSQVSWLYILYVIAIIFGIVFIVYGIRSIKYENEETLYDKELREAARIGYKFSVVEKTYLKEYTYYEPPTYYDAIRISFFLIGLILAIVVVIVSAVLFVLSLMGGSSSSSPSSSSSSHKPPSNSNSFETGVANGPAEVMYTVNYRYPSGSAILDECQYFYFNHQPSIDDVKRKIKSMGWGINTDSVDVYCIRFGKCLPSATESHPDNLL